MRLLLVLLFVVNLFAEIGVVSAINGDAYIKRGTKSIKVVLNGKLEEKDTIITKQDTRVQIIFKDRTVISIGENSQFSIGEYLFEESKKPKAKFNMLKGIFRTLTGKIGKIAPERFKLKTKNATIGIRGTEILLVASPLRGDKIACTKGAIEVVSNFNKTIVVVKAGQITQVKPNSSPLPPRKLKQNDINQEKKSKKKSKDKKESKEKNKEKKKKTTSNKKDSKNSDKNEQNNKQIKQENSKAINNKQELKDNNILSNDDDIVKNEEMSQEDNDENTNPSSNEGKISSVEEVVKKEENNKNDRSATNSFNEIFGDSNIKMEKIGGTNDIDYGYLLENGEIISIWLDGDIITSTDIIDSYIDEKQTATYSGTSMAISNKEVLKGNMNFSIYFDEHKFSGNIDFQKDETSARWDFNARGYITNSGFSSNNIKTNEDSDVKNISGYLEGKFYGKEANSIGGTFDVSGDIDGEQRKAIGAFAGSKE